MNAAESCCADEPSDDEMHCTGDTVESHHKQKLQANEVAL